MHELKRRELALLFFGAAMVGLAGCGGGGGGGAGNATAPAQDAAQVSTGAPSSGASTTPAQAPVASTPGAAPMLGDCELFPANAIFNTRIDDVARFPAHAKSGEWVDLVGRSVPFSTDWGVNDNPANYGTYWG